LKAFADIWTPHTLRHTWITISENKVAMPPAHSRLLANHAVNAKGDAHMGYIHPDFDDLHKSQEMMSEFLLAAIQPTPEPSGNVVSLRKSTA
jgi:integrase